MADDGADIAALLHAPLRLGSGRRAKPVRATFVRSLTVDDLILSSESESAARSEGPVVKELRQSHHIVARLLGKGARPGEVSSITGYSLSRISVLQADPAFAELVEYYSAMEEKEWSDARADMHQRLATIGFDASEVLHERLLDSPETFDNKTLLAVVEATADRTGYGKTSTVQHQHELSISDENLARVKASVTAGAPLAEADRRALVRLASLRTAELHSAAEEGEGGDGGGPSLREAGGEVIEGEVLRESFPLSPVDSVLRPEREGSGGT